MSPRFFRWSFGSPCLPWEDSSRTGTQISLSRMRYNPPCYPKLNEGANDDTVPNQSVLEICAATWRRSGVSRFFGAARHHSARRGQPELAQLWQRSHEHALFAAESDRTRQFLSAPT